MEHLGLLRSIEEWEILEGVPSPLGATWFESHRAYNFAIYSRCATAVTLLFYSERDPSSALHEFPFDYHVNKTGRVWHCWIPESRLMGATLYGYRIHGPIDGRNRFDSSKILLDPHAHEVWFPPDFDRDAARRPGSNEGKGPLGVLPHTHGEYDWGADIRPRHLHEAVVYELHVKGFTARPNSGVGHPGTYSGIVEKIPYLKELGVTVVELLPVHQFDPQEGNYWGYMTLSFFAPHNAYAARDDSACEFRDMVKALHEAGIEVWLDVVYNHTAEGDEHGPTYSYRAIDNQSYYLLSREDRYLNDTGCGNTIRAEHPATRAMILGSLRHWATEMHVDGFRFDLASILARNGDGSVNYDCPALITEITMLGYLADVRMIAEAWDLGAYLLGRSFPGSGWLQWNGKYRDDIRDFVRSAPGGVPSLMRRLYGSNDLFPDTLEDSYRPYQSVNFITAHDGFCLYDLVSYNHKHNSANGHCNTDGCDDNRSWNCGWEGDVDVPDDVLALRRRQVKNFFALLMLSNGTPMFCAGDEFLNSQQGNNNPYNQDNETTWLDWDQLPKNRDIFRFFRLLIAFRKAHRSIGRPRFWRQDVRWYGTDSRPDLSWHSHSLAYFLDGASVDDDDLYVMINAWWEPLTFVIQERDDRPWLSVLDTSLPAPEDIAEAGAEPEHRESVYHVGPRSVAVLRRRKH